jgi:hypothetical protein
MSLKSLEMQVALPRTQDFGKMQEQMNQRAMVNQQQSSQEEKVKAELDRKRSAKMEGKNKGNISSEDQSSSNGYAEQKNKRQKDNDQSEDHSAHPFKGKHIDISL